jgi:hypothetical protein
MVSYLRSSPEFQADHAAVRAALNPLDTSSSAAAMGESQGSWLEQALRRSREWIPISVVFRMADSLFKLFDIMVHLRSPDEIFRQRAAAADAPADAEGAVAETAVAAQGQACDA